MDDAVEKSLFVFGVFFLDPEASCNFDEISTRTSRHLRDFQCVILLLISLTQFSRKVTPDRNKVRELSLN